MKRNISSFIRQLAAGILLAAGWCVALSAQTATTGTVGGRIVDSDSATALPGAQVTIVGLDLSTSTNRQGEFFFGTVPAGSYQLQVSYIGANAVNEPISVTAGAHTPVRIRLNKGEAVVMDKIEVAGIIEGTGRALNQQRTAPNQMSIIASDAIGQFPDPNIAEALQRSSGIGVQRDQGEGRYIQVRGTPAEFSAVTVDGVSVQPTDVSSRRVDLDTIPSDVVDSLEITKALRSDQDADSIGGAINITTQSPFTYDGLRIRTSLGQGYNDYGGKGDTRGNIMISQRFGAEKNFGVLVSASYSKTRRKVDNLENVWIPVVRPEGDEIMGLEDIDLKDYDSVRTRRGATGSFEWRPSPGNKLFLRGSFSAFNDTEQRNRIQVLWAEGTLQPGATDRAATRVGSRLTKQLRDVNRFNEIATVSAGGVHQLGTMTLDYTLATSRSANDTPHHREHLYRTSNNVRVSYDFSRNLDTPYYSVFDTKEHLELNRYSFRENLKRTTFMDEDEVSFMSNLSMPFALGQGKAVGKVGVKYRTKDRAYDDERYRDRTAAGAAAGGIASLLSDAPSQNYSYFLGQKFDPDKVAPLFDRPYPASTYLESNSRTGDYNFDENITAGYGLVEVDYGKLDVFAGVRVERTEFKAKAERYNSTRNTYTPQSVDRSYTDLFPGVHARYAITDTFLARAAITRAINRPNYTDMVPRVTESDDVGTTLNVSAGNPNLNSTLSNNFDVGLEYYFRPVGLVSAGLFFKDLDDYRFNSRTRGTFDGRPAVITRPENAQGGQVLGLELAYQQQFTKLPGFLSGFGVITNYTWTDSEVTAPFIDPATGVSSRSRKVQLPGQSKSTYNVALFYDKYGFNARVSYTSRTDYLDSIDTDDGAEFDTWWVGRGQLDATASYQLSRRIQLFGEAKNLSNTRGIRYQGERKYPTEIEQFGYILFAGVRLTL